MFEEVCVQLWWAQRVPTTLCGVGGLSLGSGKLALLPVPKCNVLVSVDDFHGGFNGAFIYSVGACSNDS